MSIQYDTSHVAYPKGLTIGEQHAKWAIFTALQPPREDISIAPTNWQTSTTATLHTYPLKYILSYIFPSTTSSPPLAPTTYHSPILLAEPISSLEPAIP